MRATPPTFPTAVGTDRPRPAGRGAPRAPASVFGILLVLPVLVAGCGDGDGPVEASPDIQTRIQAARSSSPTEPVTDLTVTGSTETAATVAWRQVTDGSGKTAWYELRYDVSPMTWNQATAVTSGACASPIKGQQHGSTVTCTAEGLTPETGYDFQVASFRRGGGADDAQASLSNVASGTTAPGSDGSGGDTTAECDSPSASWIWCDDFEQDRLASYFEYVSHDGDFAPVAGVGLDGSTGMRARWAEGQVDAGNLKLAFGRTPQTYMDPVDDGTQDYREIYWRFFLKNETAWTGGGGDKLSRGMIFASSTSWAQAMIAHVWSGSTPDENYLVLDPASGTDEAGNLQTTTYNDFDNLRWLGADRGDLPLFDADHVGRWYCVEVRVRLNDAGSSNGEFQLWIDGTLDAERTGLNWVGDYSDYGINAIFLENYWNTGSPPAQERYFDNFVVSTEPIGCSTG